MANLVYYKEEREQFKDAFATKLSQGEATYIFDRLKSRYKFSQHLIWRGRHGGGSCSSWRVRLGHNTNLGTLLHEIGHAIQMKKGKTDKQKWHTKKHRTIMARLVRFMDSRTTQYQLAVFANNRRSEEEIAQRNERKAAKEAEKGSPTYKLNKLKEIESKWQRQIRISSNRLKKVQRRIGIWTRKAACEGDLPQMIDPLQAANDLWNEIGV